MIVEDGAVIFRRGSYLQTGAASFFRPKAAAVCGSCWTPLACDLLPSNAASGCPSLAPHMSDPRLRNTVSSVPSLTALRPWLSGQM